MFDFNHAIKISQFCSIAIASSNTDIFVCALHHFSQLVYFSLNKFWFVGGQSNSLTIVPIHDLVEKMSADIIEILSAVHALTGCEITTAVHALTGCRITSKTGKKAAALKCMW